MKNTHYLYGISIFAVIGVLVCFIGHAIDTRPMHMPKQHTPEMTPVPTDITETFVKKQKNCSCCAKRIREFRTKLQKAREAREARKRQLAAQQTRTAPDETILETPTSSEKNAGSRPWTAALCNGKTAYLETCQPFE